MTSVTKMYARENNEYELLPTEIQIIKDETIAVLYIIETIYYRTSYSNKLYDTL